MGKKYVENTGDSPMWVSGMLIAPGEGREVEVPDEAPAPIEEAAPDLDAPLIDLLKGNVGVVKEGLGALSNETLERLAKLEGEAEHPRKTLLEAIADEAIRRADDKLKSDSL